MALHNLSFTVPTRVKCNNQLWTPTISESQDAFLLKVKHSNTIVKEMKKVKIICETRGIAKHPVIFEVDHSEKTEYFVAVYETIYQCPSLIAAVDTAFKLFVMWKIPFPPQCVKVWLFLNQIFYKINLPQQPNFKMVSISSSYQL